MPFSLLHLLLTVLAVVHIIRSGRDRIWIYVVALLPYAGALAYLIVEVLPGLLRSRTAQSLGRSVKNTLDPHADLRRHNETLDLVDTVANRIKIADEYLSKAMYAEALTHFQTAAKGLYVDDPQLMLGQAQALFGLKQYDEARQMLITLREKNPDFKSADGHLLYARCCAALAMHEQAEEEFVALMKYFSGPEAPLHYAEYLIERGQPEKAQALLADVIKQAKHGGRPYERLHAQALKKVRGLIKSA